MNARVVRTILVVVMNLLVLVAALLAIRLVVEFFGQLYAQDWGKMIVAVTQPLVIPFGVDPIKTPYGGVFDVAATLTIVVVLVAEWVLEGVRIRG